MPLYWLICIPTSRQAIDVYEPVPSLRWKRLTVMVPRFATVSWTLVVTLCVPVARFAEVTFESDMELAVFFCHAWHFRHRPAKLPGFHAAGLAVLILLYGLTYPYCLAVVCPNVFSSMK